MQQELEDKPQYKTSTGKLQEIKDNILRQYQAKTQKFTQTPFGSVHSELKTIVHSRPMKKGEILAQWVRDKRTGKKETFVWLGVIERSDYDTIACKWRIRFRPFVSQSEQIKKREEQLWTRQFYG